MAKRFTDSEKWKKRFFKKLCCKYKLLWLYILDDCNHAGIWDIDLEVAGLRVGEEFKEKEVLNIFKDNVIPIDNNEKWFVPKFIEFQYGELNPESRVHQSVIKILDKYNLNQKDKSPETAKKSIKRFKKPSWEEVSDYCNERMNNVDAKTFVDFYESKGWKIGKNPMKDWKAAVRTWEKKDNKSNNKSKVQGQIQEWQKARQIIENQ
tara:strand:- start:2073 stop:2693 length:621 start_codon:yes stop_codon:yes gene_type:complete